MKSVSFLVLTLWMIFASIAVAQNESHSVAPKVRQELDAALTKVEHDFLLAADAMPEGKFDFKPSNGRFEGVRTFGQQIKHVAAANYTIGSGMLEEAPPVDTNHENGPDSLTTKTEIMNYLRRSYDYLHRAFATVKESNLVEPVKNPFGGEPITRIKLATHAIGHANDHYGQMVEYLRMNDIVPPASRK